MEIDLATVIISIITSSLFTALLSKFILEPYSETRKYIFDEKKRVYDSVIIFAQIVLFPEESHYSLGVARYNIQELSDKQKVERAINDLKMSKPKLSLISRSSKVAMAVDAFVNHPCELNFSELLATLKRDLYSIT